MAVPPVPIVYSDVVRHLVGLDSWLTAAAASATQYDANAITTLIPEMIRRFEEETQFRINQVQVVSNPDGTYDAGVLDGTGLSKDGSIPLYIDTPYLYEVALAQDYLRTHLRLRPIVQVQRLRLMLNTAQSVLTIPPSWFRVEPRNGLFTIQPVSGAVAVGGSVAAYAVMLSTFGNLQYVPQLMAFDYVAGLPIGWQTTAEWMGLKRALSQYCAYAVLQDISELYDAGLSGKSIGTMGRSESLQYSRFQNRKKELYEAAISYQAIVKDQYRPVLLGAV